MFSTILMMIVYGSLWVWFFGGFAEKKPDKPKTPEQELGDSLVKYISSLDIPKKPNDKK